jgi:hypothetical protein
VEGVHAEVADLSAVVQWVRKYPSRASLKNEGGMSDMVSCNRCLLNEEVPGVKIENDGTCTVCKEHDKKWGDWGNIKLEKKKEIEKILENIKKKNRVYDVLVPLSGGKDSAYVLYICREVYDLKCLAVTWDNGFLTDHARKNVKKACDILGVDHVYYGINEKLLMELYKIFFLKTGFLCPICMRGIQVATSKMQETFNIPLTLTGTSLRTEEFVSKEFFLPGSIDLIENVLDGNPLKDEAEALLTPMGYFRMPLRISLPNHIDWDYDEIFNTIRTKMNWEAHHVEAEHTDCGIDNIVHYIRRKKFPALIPEMLRYSKLVTAGVLSRADAEKKIEQHNLTEDEPKNLDWFFKKINITRQEFDAVLNEDPLRHLLYLKPKSKAARVSRRLKYIKKRFF